MRNGSVIQISPSKTSSNKEISNFRIGCLTVGLLVTLTIGAYTVRSDPYYLSVIGILGFIFVIGAVYFYFQNRALNKKQSTTVEREKQPEAEDDTISKTAVERLIERASHIPQR